MPKSKLIEPAGTMEDAGQKEHIGEASTGNTDAFGNSRTLTRQIASEMVAQRITPVADQVRKAIVERTGGARNPSSSTIQDELNKWYADTFWPTYTAFSALPDDSTVPAALQRLFADSFQSVVVGAMQIAETTYKERRESYEYVIASLKDQARAEVIRQESQEVKFRQLEDQLAQAMTMILRFETSVAESNQNIVQLEQKLRKSLETQVALEHQISAVRETERTQGQVQIDAARADTKRAMLELDDARQANKNLLAVAERTSNQMSQMRDQIVRLETQNTMLQEAAERTRAEQLKKDNDAIVKNAKSRVNRTRSIPKNNIRTMRSKPSR